MDFIKDWKITNKVDPLQWTLLSNNEKLNTPLLNINDTKCWSEFGQDYLVLQLLNFKKNGYFIELGADDGLRKSNTYTLEKYYDWDGICIEPRDGIYETCKSRRTSLVIKQCIDYCEHEISFCVRKGIGGTSGIIAEDCDNKINKGKEITYVTKTLEQVLDENNAPKEIDYLSLDIEGAEYRVLKNFPFDKYIIKIMTIERPNDLLLELLNKNNYKIVHIFKNQDWVFYR